MKLTGIDRTKRVKEARDEAKKEIEAYRKSKDEEFKKFEAEVCELGIPCSPHYFGNCSDWRSFDMKINTDYVICSTPAATRRLRKMQIKMLRPR